ncbi:MAG: hypothetical protein LBC77_09420 [Spirochaetaceae bacterium]|jgi:hypothetical protein|nr:hypothetical protein [Spirochaetaceae bacterium]
MSEKKTAREEFMVSEETMENAVFMKLEQIEKRISLLEKCAGFNGDTTLGKSVIELDLTLPMADIDGLHFNKTEVRAVFELKDDGWYHSRDILFLSARNTEDDNSRDILTEYLNKIDFKQAIYQAFYKKYTAEPLFAMGLKRVLDIEVSLPKGNEGVKKYNGVDWWYWLADRFSESTAYFCDVNNNGNAYYYIAYAVGGCAPAFRVA